MTYEEILEKTTELLAEITDADDINSDSDIMGDLDISSMDLLTLLCSLEAEFDIHLPERTIRNVVYVKDLADAVYNAFQK